VSRKVFLWRKSKGEQETLVLDGRGREWTITGRGWTQCAEVAALPDGRLSVLLSDGRQVSGRIARRARGEIVVSTSRGSVRMSLADPLHDRLEHSASAGDSSEELEDVRALMPGRVIEVAVSPGQLVEKGTLLLVLEAMKMQNEIRAEQSGVVQRVAIRAGETVEGGVTLLTVQPVRS
jgi:biotin carboxyl carrier protein